MWSKGHGNKILLILIDYLSFNNFYLFIDRSVSCGGEKAEGREETLFTAQTQLPTHCRRAQGEEDHPIQRLYRSYTGKLTNT